MSDLRSGVMKGMREPRPSLYAISEKMRRGYSLSREDWEAVRAGSDVLAAAKALADAAQNARNYIAETNTSPRHPAIVEILDMCISAFRAAGG